MKRNDNPPFLQIAPLKYCFCSENVILEKPEIGDKNEEMYFDMESRGIEFVASKYKFPRLILKVPFDFVGENGNVNGKKYGDLSEKISELLVNLPYHESLGKILDWISHQ